MARFPRNPGLCRPVDDAEKLHERIGLIERSVELDASVPAHLRIGAGKPVDAFAVSARARAASA